MDRRRTPTDPDMAYCVSKLPDGLTRARAANIARLRMSYSHACYYVPRVRARAKHIEITIPRFYPMPTYRDALADRFVYEYSHSNARGPGRQIEMNSELAQVTSHATVDEPGNMIYVKRRMVGTVHGCLRDISISIENDMHVVITAKEPGWRIIKLLAGNPYIDAPWGLSWQPRHCLLLPRALKGNPYV